MEKNVAIWIPSIIFVIASLYTGLVILVVCCGSERQLLDLIQVCRFPAIHCADHNRPCEGVKDDFGIVDNTCIILYPESPTSLMISLFFVFFVVSHRMRMTSFRQERSARENGSTTESKMMILGTQNLSYLVFQLKRKGNIYIVIYI